MLPFTNAPMMTKLFPLLCFFTVFSISLLLRSSFVRSWQVRVMKWGSDQMKMDQKVKEMGTGKPKCQVIFFFLNGKVYVTHSCLSHFQAYSSMVLYSCCCAAITTIHLQNSSHLANLKFQSLNSNSHSLPSTSVYYHSTLSLEFHYFKYFM